MATILAVDTALGACSAALLEDDRVLAHRFAAMERGHAEALAPMVEAVMDGTGFAALDRLAVTVGPGTFTGQRVGLAFMRALRIALKKPLTGVTSLAAMAEQARAETGLATAAAIHDARRDEVYVEILGADPFGPALLAFADAAAMIGARGTPIALAGTAALRLEAALMGLARVANIAAPDAVWVARLALALPATDTAPRPLYLRAPDAKLPTRR